MSFLKGKNEDGKQTLVAVSQIAVVTATGSSTTVVELVNGNEIELDLGFQSVVNRVKELGADVA